MDIRTQTINEIVTFDRKRIQDRFIHEAIREWDSIIDRKPVYYSAFIQIYVSQKWSELILSN